MAELELRGIAKVFADGTHAVHALDLAVRDGELMVLVGPSGCGKSTILRLIAGLESASAGSIVIGGEVADAWPPQRRNVAMVFQNYALYPHMTVRGNLEFPLRMAGIDKAERRRRVERTAELLGLGELLARRPARLSGGQRQRVAMGRALVREPALFLMDEPLSNLDAELRVRIRAEIAAIQRRLRTTTIYVTHDQVEAMTLGDRIAVLREGRLQQVGAPQEVYDHPANAFVATFLGSPGMNLVPPGALGLPGEDAETIGFRPERLRPASEAAADGVEVVLAVEAVEALGNERIVHGTVAGAPDHRIAARLRNDVAAAVGERLALCVPRAALHRFDAQGEAVPEKK